MNKKLEGNERGAFSQAVLWKSITFENLSLTFTFEGVAVDCRANCKRMIL